MGFLLEILLEILLQIVGEIVAELLYGLGDIATHGRMRRVLVFGFVGGFAGLVSYGVRPRYLFPDAVTRWVAVASLVVVGGVFLAFVEARVLRGGRGSATAGFLSGAGFGAAYSVVRHLLLS